MAGFWGLGEGLDAIPVSVAACQTVFKCINDACHIYSYFNLAGLGIPELHLIEVFSIKRLFSVLLKDKKL